MEAFSATLHNIRPLVETKDSIRQKLCPIFYSSKLTCSLCEGCECNDLPQDCDVTIQACLPFYDVFFTVP